MNPKIEVEDHSLSAESIRATYSNMTEHPYRVSKQCYPPGSSFGGASRAGSIYILSGRCRLITGGESVDVRAGQVVRISTDGSYDFTVLGDEEANVVRVWKLPSKFRGDT